MKSPIRWTWWCQCGTSACTQRHLSQRTCMCLGLVYVMEYSALLPSYLFLWSGENETVVAMQRHNLKINSSVFPHFPFLFLSTTLVYMLICLSHYKVPSWPVVVYSQWKHPHTSFTNSWCCFSFFQCSLLFFFRFIILPPYPGLFSRAHLLGWPMKRAILSTQSPWY